MKTHMHVFPNALFSILLSLALVVLLVPQAALASGGEVGSTFEADGVTYTITSENEVSVGAQSAAGTNFASSAEHVAIPATVNGYTVTGVNAYAFSDGATSAAALESIELPGTLESIGAYAFYGCTQLAGVEIPASVTSIKRYAFADCTGLESLVFEGAANITEPKLSVGEGAFSTSDASAACSLRAVDLPARLASVAVSLFENQTSLKDVSYNGGTSFVGAKAFKGCTAIEELHIPALTLGDGAISEDSYQGLSSLKTIVFEGDENYDIDDTFFAVSREKPIFNGYVYTYSDVENIVYHGTHTSTIFEGVKHYYNVDFYSSKAAASEGGTPAGSARVNANAVTSKIAATDVFSDGGAIPVLGAGKVWYFPAYAQGDTLMDSTTAYAVDANDLAYGEAAFAGDTTEFTYNGAAQALSYEFRSAAGTLLSAGNDYTVTLLDGSGSEINAGQFVDPGSYTLRINAASGSAYTGTYEVALTITKKAVTFTRLSGNAYYATPNHVGDVAFSAENIDTVIVVNEEQQALGLALNGFAGARGSLVLASPDKSLSLEVKSYLTKYEPESVYLLGFTDTSTIRNQVEELLSGSVSVSASFDAATAGETLANLFSRTATREYWADSTTAVVASVSDMHALAAIAPYAYKLRAPMFVTSSEGGLDASVSAALAKHSGITKVVLAGLSTTESAAVRTALGSGYTYEEWAAQSDAYATSTSYAETMLAGGAFSLDSLVLASASDVVDCITGASVCGALGVPLLFCDDTAAGRTTLDGFVAAYQYEVAQGYVLGVRAYLSAPFVEEIQAMWTLGSAYDLNTASISLQNAPSSYTQLPYTATAKLVTSGGTTLVEGVRKTGSWSSVTLTPENADYYLRVYDNSTDMEVSGRTITEPGSYTVTAYGAGDDSYFNSVSVELVLEAPTPQTSDTFTAGKVTYKITGGKSVSVKKVAASASGTLSIPASVKGYKVTAIAAKAFKGCSKIKVLNIASSKIASVGAGAFNGTRAKLKVKVPKAKVKVYKKMFRKAGLSKKAKVVAR